MDAAQALIVTGLIVNLLFMLGGLVKIIGFFTRLENRLTALETAHKYLHGIKSDASNTAHPEY